MARTFTGLKLQGSIGKFGNEELSDVSGYADLPDGMVNTCISSLVWLVARPVAAKAIGLFITCGLSEKE